MKLIVAIVQDKDGGRLLSTLVQKGFKATKLASTGGFIREGNTTLIIGVEDEQVDKAIDIIKDICRSREQLVTPLTAMGGPEGPFFAEPIEVQVGGATIFVLNVEQFKRV